jgi:hypothetical protein
VRGPPPSRRPSSSSALSLATPSWRRPRRWRCSARWSSAATIGLGRVVAFHYCSSRFTPDSRACSVPLLLNRQCNRTLGNAAAWDGSSVASIARTPDAGGWVATKPLTALLRGHQKASERAPIGASAGNAGLVRARRSPVG